MTYTDRAVQVLKDAQAALRGIIEEALDAHEYRELAALAKLAEALAQIIQETGGTGGQGPVDTPAAAPGHSDPPDERSVAHDRSALRVARGPSARSSYPRYLRDGDRLVKVAWSKKEGAPYEHRAPREVVQLLVDRILTRYKHVGDGRVFEAAHVMPVKSGTGEEYPSYQVYLALGWLRDVGAITKKGREGYILKRGAVSHEKLDELWNALPATE